MQIEQKERVARYRAFISYSHRDTTWAAWLHRAIERTRIPRDLVGRPSTIGNIPATLRPVFRDRDDLAAASSLGESVKAALDGSEFLIVICSRSSARSDYVNEEIRAFKAMGRHQRILAVIVDGNPDDRENDCFPSALRHKVSVDGSILTEVEEPLAADVRPKADGKEGTRLKIIAGLLGVPLDDIVRRHKRQQRWFQALKIGSVLAAIGLCAAFYLLDLQRRTAAEAVARSSRVEDLRRVERLTEEKNYDVAVATALKVAEQKPYGPDDVTAEQGVLALRRLYQAYQLRKVLDGEVDSVRHVSISARGDRIVAVSGRRNEVAAQERAVARNTGAVQLWNAQTGVRIADLVGPGEMMEEPRLSSDGEFVALGPRHVFATRDGRQIDLGQGESEGVFIGWGDKGRALVAERQRLRMIDFAAPTNAVALEVPQRLPLEWITLSPAGDHVIGGNDHTMYLWNGVTGKYLGVLGDSSDVIDRRPVFLDAHGRCFALISSSGNVSIWDIQKKAIATTFQFDFADSVELNETEDMAIVSSKVSSRLWSIKRKVFVEFGALNNAKSLKFVSGGIFSQSTDDLKTAIIFDPGSGKQVNLGSRSGADFKVSADRATISAWDGKEGFVYDANSGGVLGHLNSGNDYIVDVSSNGAIAVSGSHDGKARVYDVGGAGRSPDKLPIDALFTRAVHFSRDRGLIALIDSYKGPQLLWRPNWPDKSEQLLSKPQSWDETGVSVDPTGSRALFKSQRRATILDIVPPFAVRYIDVAPCDSRSPMFSPSGGLILVPAVGECGSLGQKTQVYDATTGRIIQSLADARLVAMSADEKKIAIGLAPEVFTEKRLLVGSLRDGAKTALEMEAPMAIAFDAKGVLLFAADVQGRAKIFNLRSGTTIALRPEDGAAVVSGMFSPDSKMLAVVAENGSIQLIDAADGKIAGHLQVVQGRKVSNDYTAAGNESALAFNHLGSQLAVAYESNDVMVWDVGRRSVLARFPSKLSNIRNISWQNADKSLVISASGNLAEMWTIPQVNDSELLNWARAITHN